MGSLFHAFIINLFSIQPNKSYNQTYNAQIFLKKPKAVYFDQVAEQKP